MSGSCYNSGNRNPVWTDEYDKSPLNQDAETDAQSQISDRTDDQSASSVRNVKERMKMLFETQSFTDVTFYPKNNRRLSISAHRAVLAIASPLFKKMLFGDENKDTAGMKMEVQISNLSFDAFTNVVKYIYTDEVFFENDSLVQGIFEGAKQFNIQPLVHRCKQYFESLELTDENVCSKLQLSISDKISVLKDRCIEFIQTNTLQVINSADFRKCNPSTVRTICKLQSLNMRSEMDLLEAVMQWLYAQPSQNRKLLLEPLLKCIRFLTFTVTELGDALKKYPDLLTANEGLSIMLYLYNPPKSPDFKSLPSWCNKNTMSRCFFRENPCGLDPKGNDPNTPLVGRVIFALKTDQGQNSVAELTSLLQMKCMYGRHQIKAIRLTFEKPLFPKSIIGTLSINLHVHPSGFRTFETVQVVNSESIRVEFRREVKVSLGDLLDIEAEAKNIQSYRFLQFDDSRQMPLNPHFKCCVSSRPKLGKLFFISEIEYGPQEKGKPNFRRKFPPRNHNW